MDQDQSADVLLTSLRVSCLTFTLQTLYEPRACVAHDTFSPLKSSEVPRCRWTASGGVKGTRGDVFNSPLRGDL